MKLAYAPNQHQWAHKHIFLGGLFVASVYCFLIVVDGILISWRELTKFLP